MFYICRHHIDTHAARTHARTHKHIELHVSVTRPTFVIQCKIAHTIATDRNENVYLASIGICCLRLRLELIEDFFSDFNKDIITKSNRPDYHLNGAILRSTD